MIARGLECCLVSQGDERVCRIYSGIRWFHADGKPCFLLWIKSRRSDWRGSFQRQAAHHQTGQHQFANDEGMCPLMFEVDGFRRGFMSKISAAFQPNKKSRCSRPTLKNPKQIGSGIPGTVLKVLVNEGEEVKQNQALVIVEAMKMETRNGRQRHDRRRSNGSTYPTAKASNPANWSSKWNKLSAT